MKFNFNFLSKASFGFLIFLILVVVSSSVVLAIGATPPFAYMDYTQSEDSTYSFMLLNNNPDPNIEVELSLSGALAPYATLSEDSFFFDGKGHSFYVTFNFPNYEDIGVYGKQKLRIRASEVGKQNGMFVVGTAVEVWIEVYIPVPGSFAEVNSLKVNNAFEGEDTDFSFVLRNRGSNDIVDSSATLYVKDFSGKVMDTFFYSDIDVPYDGLVPFNGTISSSSYDSGMYTALVEYNFADDFAPSKASKIFFLGSSDVIITNYTSQLVAGEINKVIVTAQSLWGSALNDVIFDLNYNGASHVLPYVDFSPFQSVRFETFIEAPLIEDKDIDSIPFNAVMNIEIPVSGDEVVTKSIPLSFTVNNPSSSFSLSSTTILIVGGVLLLLLLILFNVIFLSRLKKSDSIGSEKKNSKKKNKK